MGFLAPSLKVSDTGLDGYDVNLICYSSTYLIYVEAELGYLVNRCSNSILHEFIAVLCFARINYI